MSEIPQILDYLDTKFFSRIYFEDSLNNEDDGSNDFRSWKRIGIFMVHGQKLPKHLAPILQKYGFKENENILELHIPEQETSVESVYESIERLREYLFANQNHQNFPRLVYGISYLAKASKRFGFTVVEIPDNLKEKSKVAKTLLAYDNSDIKKRERIARRYTTRDIKLSFMSVDRLLWGRK